MMPSHLNVNGIDFHSPDGKWDYGNVLLAPDQVLKIDYPHPNKINRLVDEVMILRHLNALGAVCVPRLRSSGILEGSSYPQDVRDREFMILERIVEKPGLEHVDVLRACMELKSFGYLHGDLKRENIIFDGTVAVLIDFDQTVHEPAVAAMSMNELLEWGDEKKGQFPWKQCYPLRNQLEAFCYSKLADDPRLDIWKYPLSRGTG
jgi:hypothetical protein